MKKIIILFTLVLSFIKTYAGETCGAARRYDVHTICNLLYDFVYQVPESFIEDNNLAKDTTTWIDAEQAAAYLKKLQQAGYEPVHDGSGGSAGNTTSGLHKLGLNVGIMGVLGSDDLATRFQQKLHEDGIALTHVPAVDSSRGTGVCFVLVTPDGKRTMLTNLGVSGEINIGEEEIETIACAKNVLLEGYLFKPEITYKSICRAAERTKEKGNNVILTLSADFCVENNKENMLAFVTKNVDILFGNEQEAMKLTGTCSALCAAYTLQSMGKIGAVTCGEKGAYVFDKDNVYFIHSPTVGSVVDTTGAGDQFAAGFLYGLWLLKSIQEAGQIAASCAGEVISAWGAHPHDPSLKRYIDEGAYSSILVDRIS